MKTWSALLKTDAEPVLVAESVIWLSAVPTLVDVTVTTDPNAVAVTLILAPFRAIAAARLVASTDVVALVCQFNPVFTVALAVRVMVAKLLGLVIVTVSLAAGVPVNVPVWLAETAAAEGVRLVLYTTKSGCVAVPQLALEILKENFAG